MKRFNDFINEKAGLSDLEKEYLDKGNKYKGYLEGIMKYIIENYSGDILEKGRKLDVYGTEEHETSEIEFRINTILSNKITNWQRSEEYIDSIDDAKNETSEIIDIIESLNLQCSLCDFGENTHVRIEIFNLNFKENKSLMNALSTLNKFKL